MEAVAYLLPLVAFVALFAFLARRATRRHLEGRGPRPQPFWPTQARWLALIAACALVAIVAGALD